MPVNTILNDIKKLTVIELADLVKAIEEEFGVSGSAQVSFVEASPSHSSAAASAKSEEKSEYKVNLKDSGDQKIKVIKALRASLPGLGLKEAKDMVDGAPCVVSEAMPKEDAQKLKKELEEAGATVELA